MTPCVITGQQNPVSPQSVQGHAPGAVIDAAPLRYAGTFSLTHISIHMSVAAPVITENVSAQYLACCHHHFRAILQVQMWALTEYGTSLLLTHPRYLDNVLFHDVFSFPADVNCDHQKCVRTLSRRACEAFMQEDKPRHHQPRLQPAAVT